MKEEVTILWPDTLMVEVGEALEENDDSVHFKSHYDGTINWVPKKYIKEDLK